MSTTLLTGRLPAHAGTFYPADRDELAELVDGLLEGASARLPRVASSVVRGVLVPHASLASSGTVAAAGWAMVGTIQPATLVLLGTDHADLVPGVAVWTDGPWSGPLGDVAIDHGLAHRIAALGPPFRVDDVAHRGEHSLEVQMPFLSRTCPEARIVPLLVGNTGPSVAQMAGAWLGRLLASLRGGGERVVLVVSSDLTLDGHRRVAREADRHVLRPILALDAEELGGIGIELRASGGTGIGCAVCGLAAVSCALVAVDEMGASHGRLLAEAASADRDDAGRHGAASYAAVAFVC
ncbi:MAG: AmmeMemoRadiSam system protein B [Chloroflexi bacterium RBG_16_69_14]|nr:MAG: AmmeMemoRadiSam system protein B [Chloroflexi bacterium RBG_16_69_14]